MLTGFTSSVDFPTEKPLYNKLFGGADDVFITKFNNTGRSLVFSTFLGGSNSDNGVRLTTDRDNYIYVTGYTSSTDFPIKNPAQLFHRGAFDAFLIKLNPDGQDAVFSTYIGAEDTEGGTAIAVSADGTIYLAGFTNSLEFYAINAINGFLRGARDAFVMKIASDASNVIFSTYLGGFGVDGATAIAVDGSGNAYVTGFTFSADFPLADNAFQAGIGGEQDGFIVKINAEDIKTTSPFVIPIRGGANIATAGQTAVTIFGYAAADLEIGQPPSGMEVVDLRSVGVLVNEVGIPAAPAISVGRLMARTATGDSTAVSMANRSSEEIRVDFYFTAEDGTTSDFGYFLLPANGHVSSLLTGEPFNIPAERSGTLTFTTSVPLFATALRIDTTSSVPVNTYVPIVDPYTANDRPVTNLPANCPTVRAGALSSSL